MTVNLGEIAVTQQQVDLMKHALGLDNTKRAYRNHFAALIVNTGDWDNLVKKGLAEKGENTGRLIYYHVSELGRQFLDFYGIEGVRG
ncbi:hypothetical protein [Paenilisteria rocourtiae]|uniref:Uncharacterized protein n=1 Tax=Listeria rocourtiae TaxID=647910 RepID=A0A4R6ZNW1_9LIST|nr:hypothetical protein [Listeria rocourtiae]TDR54213.1 hypothetical protein DFP96_103314 [Listeria rocourtiae]